MTYNYEETDFILQRNKRLPNGEKYHTNGFFSGHKGLCILLGNIWNNVLKEASRTNEAYDIDFLYCCLDYYILHVIIHENLHRCGWILFRDNRHVKLSEYQQGIESELIDSVICWIIEEEF